MTELKDKVEEGVYRTLERLGTVNILTIHQISVAAGEALERLIQRGFVRKIGYGVEIVPESMRKTDVSPKVKPSTPADERKNVKTYRNGRRQHYSALNGILPDRICQLAARIVHWIEIWGDEDAEGYPVCDKRALERGLHGSRLSEWRPALDLLLKRKAITIVGHEVTIVDPSCDEILPDPFDPTGRKRAKEQKQARRKSRPKRPLSAWVRNKILERGGAIPDEL